MASVFTELDRYDLEPSSEDLYASVDVISDDINVQLHFMCNKVAAAPRRGASNIIIVGTDSAANKVRRPTRGDYYSPIVVVDPSVKPNKVRTSFWKQYQHGVDGGLLFTKTGITYQPAWRSFFNKCEFDHEI